jgi:hypothetical protein
MSGHEMILKVFSNALESSDPDSSVGDIVLLGLNINTVNMMGQTLLTTVLGDVEKSRILVKYGANPFIGVYPKTPSSTTIDVINIANERSLDRFTRFIDVLRRYDRVDDISIPYRGTILSNAIDSGDYLLTKVALLASVNTRIAGSPPINHALRGDPSTEMIDLLSNIIT